MGFLGSLLQAAVDTVAIPLDMLSDALTGGEEERTKKKVEKIGQSISEATDDLCDGDLL